MQLINSVTSITSPIIGGILLSLISIEFFILANSVSFFLSAISECFLQIPHVPPQKRKSIAPIGLRITVKYILTNKWAFRIACTDCILNFALALGVLSLFQIVVTNKWGLTSEYLGFYNSMTATGSLVASILILRNRGEKTQDGDYPQKLLIIFSVVIICCACTIWASNFISIMACFFIFSLLQVIRGGTSVFINVSLLTTIQYRTPEAILGRVLGFINACSMTMIPIGITLSGILIDRMEAYILPLISGSFMLLFLLVANRLKIFVPGSSSNKIIDEGRCENE